MLRELMMCGGVAALAVGFLAMGALLQVLVSQLSNSNQNRQLVAVGKNR